MNTAATKSPRALCAILLLRALRFQTNRPDHPFSIRENRAFYGLPTLPPTECETTLPDLAASCPGNRLLVLYFTAVCLT
jgi:hypothetical protein